MNTYLLPASSSADISVKSDGPTYPVFDDPVEILEVKYDEFLPSYIQSILSGITAQRSAISKYTHCRRYENKEF